MLRGLWYGLQLTFYALLVAISAPLVMILGDRPRAPTVDDGADLYDDDDPGQDVDG